VALSYTYWHWYTHWLFTNWHLALLMHTTELVILAQLVWQACRESSQLQEASALQLDCVLYAYLHSILHVVPVLSHIGWSAHAVMSKPEHVSVHCWEAMFHMQSVSWLHGCCVL